jgi:hypothetical protein
MYDTIFIKTGLKFTNFISYLGLDKYFYTFHSIKINTK